MGRKGGSGQRRAVLGGGDDLILRTRSPSASCPAAVLGINSCNDVRSPAAWWERSCTTRRVYILMAWQKQTDDLAAFGWCIFSLDRGFRLALTTTHQNNSDSDSTAWPKLAARTVCGEANPSPRALFAVYSAAASTSERSHCTTPPTLKHREIAITWGTVAALLWRLACT